MDRFSQLEFGDTAPQGGKPPGEPVRDVGYFYKEAMKYWLSGDYEVALRNYSRVLEQDNTFFEAWAGQVLMLIELGEYREADMWADKALELFPEHPELLAMKAIACARDAKKKEATAYSDNSVGKENLTPRVWLARAEVFMDRKGPICESCIGKAVTGARDLSPVIKLEAGRTLRRARNYPLAIQYLKEAVQLLPRSALAWYELGCCQAALRRDEASHSFEQSLRLRPHWAECQAALAKFQNRGFLRRLFGR
jgi:tetratricopeptide (TPR) repeat protein